MPCALGLDLARARRSQEIFDRRCWRCRPDAPASAPNAERWMSLPSLRSWRTDWVVRTSARAAAARSLAGRGGGGTSMHLGAYGAACPSLSVRARRKSPRRCGRACVLLRQLAIGLSVCLPAVTSFGAEQPGARAVQREIEETRAIGAEVSVAVRRLRAENPRLQRTLGIEVQSLTAEDVTASVLRLARTRCRHGALAFHDPGQSDRPARGVGEPA